MAADARTVAPSIDQVKAPDDATAMSAEPADLHGSLDVLIVFTFRFTEPGGALRDVLDLPSVPLRWRPGRGAGFPLASVPSPWARDLRGVARGYGSVSVNFGDAESSGGLPTAVEGRRALAQMMEEQ